MRRKPPSSRGITSRIPRDCPEKKYASPSDEEYLSGEWHSESPPRKSLSSASKKSDHDEFEAEIDALSSHNSDPEEPAVFDPIGKTPQEIVAWCAEYEHDNKRIMAERRRAGIAGIYHATLVYLACTHVMLAAIQAMTARATTPQTLARKRSV